MWSRVSRDAVRPPPIQVSAAAAGRQAVRTSDASAARSEAREASAGAAVSIRQWSTVAGTSLASRARAER